MERGELLGWQAESVAPADWADFTLFESVVFTLDAAGCKIQETARSHDGGAVTVQSLTQYSYDGSGRVVCTAARMHAGRLASPPANACVPDSVVGPHGPDRITRNIYDSAGRIVEVEMGVGTALAQDYARYTYTANGQREDVVDANGNRARFAYDGHDRLKRWNFPHKTSTGAVSGVDFEEYEHDANGNRTKVKRRGPAGAQPEVSYVYDALDRVRYKFVPEAGKDVTYAYDLIGRQLSAKFSGGLGVTHSYSKAGRLEETVDTTSGAARTLSYEYDSNGNRTKIVHPDMLPGSTTERAAFDYGYDGLDRLGSIREASSGGAVVGLVYDAAGRRTALTRPGEPETGYGYANGRLSSLSLDLAGTASDVTQTYAYSLAGQIVQRVVLDNRYTETVPAAASRGYEVNGLNQYTQVGATVPTYDWRGNMTNKGGVTYAYNAENLMTGTSAGVSLGYDPLNRLNSISSGGVTRSFLYDGDDLVAEYDAAGAIVRRFVHGTGVDEPLVQYEGPAITAAARRHLFADHQGSIVAIARPDGTTHINAYDAWGAPDADNEGLFQYTGQVWLPELQLYHYKARFYDPKLGRFMQVDPVRYDDQINLYAYVRNDPVNMFDSTGQSGCPVGAAAGAVVGPAGAAAGCIVGHTATIIVGACIVSTACTEAVSSTGRAAADAVLGVKNWLFNEKKPEINEDKQGKHQPGHKNFRPGRSELTDPDPQGLLDEGAGTGRQVGTIPVGEAGSKEVVDYERVIGIYVDQDTNTRQESTNGIIIYDKEGNAHIYPVRPN